MKPFIFALTLVSSTFAVAPIPTAQQAKDASNYVPDAYIVEFSDGALSRRTLVSREKVYAAISQQGIPFSIGQEYDVPGILTGAAILLSVGSVDVGKLSKIPGVQAIRPIIKVPAPKPVSSAVVDSKSTDLPDTYSTHVMTGVDKVHARGNFGKGIKIGMYVRIDYNHPLLGGGFGPKYKVIGGYDFVGDAFTGQNAPRPDNDPLDDHVAGIIGASPNNTMGISGVASDASLASYQMNILTLSVGGPSGWTEGTASVVASRIAAQGRVVTVATGNNGEDGAWYTSDPVASVDNIVSPIQNATVQGVTPRPHRAFEIFAGSYFETLPLNVAGEWPIYATSTNISQLDDACNPLPDNTPNLSSYVVITQKLMNIAVKGPNSDAAAFSAISVGNFHAVLISAADGKFLVEHNDHPEPRGGLISTFSTIGPTFEMDLSPALAAPGGNILSTIPLRLGGYAVESGTSMSTPFAAGAAALILESLGTTAEVGRAVMRILQTTAASVASSHTDGTPLQTVAQQGAGLIQVDQAINMKTIVTPGQIALMTRSISSPTIVTFSESSVTVHPKTRNRCTRSLPRLQHGQHDLASVLGLPHVISPAETLKVTYLAASVLDSTDEFFGIDLPALIDADGRPQEGPTNYTFVGQDFPYLLLRLAFGTALLRFDSWIRTSSSRRQRGAHSRGGGRRVKIIGALGELEYQARSTNVFYMQDPFSGYDSFAFQGVFANGTRIDDGQYRPLLRVLKVGGDLSKEEDYESWVGPQFGVVAT
ncbi:peptidase S8/S53 domain-containing protein [Mycena galopus ATCC 62051]|nr:peptidase S8/S53 domain-containing protein [Mycena galopus ATCC 62051]